MFNSLCSAALAMEETIDTSGRTAKLAIQTDLVRRYEAVTNARQAALDS